MRSSIWNSDKKYSDTKVLNVRHERTWSLMFSKNLFYCLNYGNKITKFFLIHFKNKDIIWGLFVSHAQSYNTLKYVIKKLFNVFG